MRALLGLALFLASHASAAFDLSRPRIPYQWLVLFREDLPRPAAKSDPRSALHASLGASLIRRLDAIQADLVQFPAGSDEAALASQYSASALVASIEPNGRVEKAGPNDALFAVGYQAWYSQIHASEAYDAWVAGQVVLQSTVMVAVLDTGANPHPELAPQLLPGGNFIPSESSSDLEGHGTFVSGIIASSAGNGAGIAGVFFDPSKIRILPVKVLDAGGRGSDDTVSQGLIYAADRGAKVMNMSLAENYKSEAVRRAVNYALRGGAFIAAAAGNDYGNAVFYPAAFPEVFAVSALDASGLLAPYSNFGRVDLGAPGGTGPGGWSACVASPGADTNTASVWSLCAFGGALYHYGSGTSFAVPMVAATAALLLSQNPSRNTQDLYRILSQSADTSAYGPGYHPQSGWGRLNVYQALTAKDGPPPGDFGGRIKAYNWPNPFNPDREGSTNLTFYLERPAAAAVRVRDMSGDLLFEKSLELGATFAGMNIVRWDGSSGTGRSASNGVYLLTVEAGGRKGSNRVMVLR